MNIDINTAATEVVEETTGNDVPVFDPNKHYEWKEDTQFLLNGIEFTILYRNMLTFLSSPFGPATTLKIADAFAIIQNKLKQSVEAGESVEKKKETPFEPVTD